VPGADANRRQRLLEWCAQVSTECEQRVRRHPLSRGALVGESWRRRGTFVQQLLERDWDPSKHPRGGFPENRGWFSPGEGRGPFDSLTSGIEPSAFHSDTRRESGHDSFAWVDPAAVPLDKLTEHPGLYLPSVSKGTWPSRGKIGEGLFTLDKPIRYGSGIVATSIPYINGVPVLDDFQIGNSATIIITGDPKTDFANAKKAWLQVNPGATLPANGRLHHNLLQITQETVEADGKKVKVLVGKMQMVHQEIHSFISHQGSASIAAR